MNYHEIIPFFELFKRVRNGDFYFCVRLCPSTAFILKRIGFSSLTLNLLQQRNDALSYLLFNYQVLLHQNLNLKVRQNQRVNLNLKVNQNQNRKKRNLKVKIIQWTIQKLISIQTLNLGWKNSKKYNRTMSRFILIGRKTINNSQKKYMENTLFIRNNFSVTLY